MEGEVNRFAQISSIFSQFSEKNKDRLIEAAKNLLKVQKEEIVSSEWDNTLEKHCPEK